VFGSGNTAMTDALYLKNIGASVTILVRGADLKGEQPLKHSIEKEIIPHVCMSDVLEILGEKQVTRIKIKNNKDGKITEMNTDAVFVAIGETPNNQLSTQIGLKHDEQGYVIIDRMGRTNIPRVYAAGDLTGGVRQIVTAVGSGATAATKAFEDMMHPYWLAEKTKIMD